MQESDVRWCLAALEAVERALVEAGEIDATVHVAMAIDRFRAGHGLPPRPIDPALVWLIEEEV